MDRRLALSVDGLGLETRAALEAAARLGFRAVEIGADRPDFSPEGLSDTGRRDFRSRLRRADLQAVALGSRPPGLRLGDPARLDEAVERTRRVIDFSARLGIPVVVPAVGRLPGQGRPRDSCLQALRDLAEFAARCGRTLALDAGPESPARQAEAVDAVGCRALLDPAALHRAGEDPLEAVQRLAARIAHVRALAGSLRRGDVPYPDILRALASLDYSGYLTVDPTGTDDPRAEASKALSYLESM